MSQRYFYVVGAKQASLEGGLSRAGANEARIQLVDTERETARTVATHRTPDGRRSEGVWVRFLCSSVRNSKLYTCTSTEVLVYDLPGFEVDRVLSKPYFRNVHHVVPTDDDTLMVVVSQFDAVVELDSDGEIRREWSVIDGDPWDDYDSTIDYRTASGDVLPEQRSHPNWVFRLDSEWWVTRFYQEDAVCLTASRPSMEIDLEKPHDGNVFGDRVYFTTVNGYVVACDAESGASREAHNLDDFSSYDAPLGWCRGLEVVEEDRIVVGFTRFRRTKSLQNISWLGEQLGIWAPLARWFYPVYLFMGNRPTRIAMYDVNTGRECWEVDLADYGLDLVYSIHSVPDEVDPTAVFDAGD